MKTVIQRTNREDFLRTENITREAFWNLYKPGCDEHLVLHNIRKSSCYISELDLVAVSENQIIGHIISTKAKIITPLDEEHEVLCVGPLSVLPEFQKMGIGLKLLNESIGLAKEKGYVGMVLFGNPGYYHRFGFVNAEKFKITTKDGQNFEPFMVLELKINGLCQVTGRFFEDDAFMTQPNELFEFEKQFPFKEKLVTETQFKQ
jgi:predicted N-acetyltransferase YhbS